MFPEVSPHAPSSVSIGIVVRSAIEPFIRWQAFILNVRSSEPMLWNQRAEKREGAFEAGSALAIVVRRTYTKSPRACQREHERFKMTVTGLGSALIRWGTDDKRR